MIFEKAIWVKIEGVLKTVARIQGEEKDLYKGVVKAPPLYSNPTYLFPNFNGPGLFAEIAGIKPSPIARCDVRDKNYVVFCLSVHKNGASFLRLTKR